MKTVLVTGGAGFLGSHLCDYLLDKGERVICMDNFVTGSIKNILHLKHKENFYFIKADIVDNMKYLNSLLKENFEITQIYNLACPASPIAYQQDAIKTIKANTEGVIHVLELAKACGARILQASTSEIYGDPEVHPQPEEYKGSVNTLGPRACYDEGKRVAETLFSDYHRAYGVDIRIARIFNTYGPRMAINDGRVVSNFIVSALKGKEMTIYGSGNYTRSFCYVDDLIEGLYKLMNSEEVYIGPINLGNPYEFSIKKLAEIIIGLVGKETNIIYNDIPQDDPQVRQPEISRAKIYLDWEPKIQLEEGLKRTIKYFEEVLK